MRYLLLLTSWTTSWLCARMDGVMTKLETGWVNEIHKSRLVILAGEGSYLPGIDMPVWRVIEQLADGVTEAKLRQVHPGLTEADIRACSLFVYLRIVGKL